MPMLPLCVTIEIGPARSVSNSDSAVAKVAVTGDAALMMPMQLGPHSVKPTSRQTAASLFCNATPSPPTSAKPPANITPLRVPRAAQAADRLGDRIGGDRQDDQIRCLWQVVDRGEALHAVHAFRARIDGPDLTRKAEAYDAPHRVATKVARAIRRADHRDRLWVQETGNVDEGGHCAEW